MFVWEAHLSTVKDNRSCLTLLLHLECPADLIRVQKLVGGVTWNASCLGTQQLFYCTEIMVLSFFQALGCSSALSFSLWRLPLFANSCLLNLHVNSSTQYHVTTCSFHVPCSTKLSEHVQKAHLKSIKGNLMCRGPLSEVQSCPIN